MRLEEKHKEKNGKYCYRKLRRFWEDYGFI
jgi:hypothetical protein